MFKYEFIDCNQSKNKFVNNSFNETFFIVRSTFVPLFTLNESNNNYNYNCLSDTTISYSATATVLFTRNLSPDCLNYNFLQATLVRYYFHTTNIIIDVDFPIVLYLFEEPQNSRRLYISLK